MAGHGQPAAKKRNPLLKLAALPAALQAVDAALSQDAYLSKIMKYRGLPTQLFEARPLHVTILGFRV